MRKKVKFVNAEYIPSNSVEYQGKRSSINKYLAQGYYVKEERNGYWLLIRPAEIRATIKIDGKQKSFNIKAEVRDYYGKKRITQKLFYNFCNDAREGIIKFYSDGNYLEIE